MGIWQEGREFTVSGWGDGQGMKWQGHCAHDTTTRNTRLTMMGQHIWEHWRIWHEIPLQHQRQDSVPLSLTSFQSCICSLCLLASSSRGRALSFLCIHVRMNNVGDTEWWPSRENRLDSTGWYGEQWQIFVGVFGSGKVGAGVPFLFITSCTVFLWQETLLSWCSQWARGNILQPSGLGEVCASVLGLLFSAYLFSTMPNSTNQPLQVYNILFCFK